MRIFESLINGLIDYGIQGEESDLRVHVSPKNSTIYVFSTQAGRDAIGKPAAGTIRMARTGNTVTGAGYAVPIQAIDGLYAVTIPPEILAEADFGESDTKSQQGKKATFVVRRMIKSGVMPIKALVKTSICEPESKDIQIRGIDLIVTVKFRIQVKCDVPACYTGNLFIQVAESNPGHSH